MYSNQYEEDKLYDDAHVYSIISSVVKNADDKVEENGF